MLFWELFNHFHIIQDIGQNLYYFNYKKVKPDQALCGVEDMKDKAEISRAIIYAQSTVASADYVGVTM